ncbi:FTR1 family protein [Pseudoxanthomonas mexicana]|uniref:FTR1 family protein n=1 Tax=Pseudoxanthomonas mexicana TaxID=128785 RepID=UPI00360E7B26
MGQALSRKSGLFLLGLIFVVVYREVFETILFYAAIWSQGNASSVIAGGLSASIVLVVIAWLMMRYSRRLPIGQFFRYSSLLIAVLAVVLIGKAVSALQEAGYLPISWLDGGPRVELLGLYPTVEGIGAQITTALILAVGFWLANRPAKSEVAAP